ncbi:MAG: endonuclease [Bacteroidia bacterium]|nr:endonuclease [Bacteroidia bacterium]
MLINACRLKYCLILFIFLQLSLCLTAQPPGYYSSAEGLTGTALQQALHDIIDNHTVVSYADLWTYFQSTDKKSNGKVWDMYSDIPSGTPAYEFVFITNQCGSYNSEGDCYNREHSFPNSWFGGEVYPMYSDLFHLYPTDGWVNNKRSNYPFGETNSATWTSTNGSKLGTCSVSGYSGTVFEPIDDYKGDFARSFFYMAVRYYGEDSGWPSESDMVTGSQPKTWSMNMLMEWDQGDPVSQKEKDRNEAVYLIQGNRNPFIDNASYANLIWGTQSDVNDISENERIIRVWPNPAGETVTIDLSDQFPDNYNIKIVNVSGRVLMEKRVMLKPVTVDVTSFETGYYILIVSVSNEFLVVPLIVSH